MMRSINYLLVIIIVASGCSDQEQVHQNPNREKPAKDELNISILIDLSNRIEQNREKDLELLEFAAVIRLERQMEKELMRSSARLDVEVVCRALVS